MKIYNSENWFYKLGIVGFNRIMKYNSQFHDLDLEDFKYKVDKEYIVFDSKLLEDFPTYYYNYFINEYNVSVSMNDKLDVSANLVKQYALAQDKDKFKKKLGEIKKIISDRNKKIEKLGVSEYKECKDIESKINKIKYEDMDELKKILSRYEEIVELDYINIPMTITYFKFVLSSSFFGQMSFLNVCNNSKTETSRRKYFLRIM